MSSETEKKHRLENLKPKKYRIYGIFDFKISRLVYVNLDLNQVMLEFDLEGYEEDKYDIVSFDILLT